MIYFAPIHVLIALIIQLGAYSLGGVPLLYGCFMATSWFVSREWSEAEYRFILNFTPNHLRAEMPWWGPLDKRVWLMSPKSFSDFLIPALVTFIVAKYWVHIVSWYYVGHA